MFKRPALSEISIREQFARAAQGFGLDLQGTLPAADGLKHYVPLVGQPKNKRAGEYKLHLNDWPSGYFKDHRENRFQTWKAEADALEMTRAEMEAITRRSHERVEQRRQARLAADRETAARAQRLIAAAFPALRSHPYIRRKAIRPDGLLQDRVGRLLVPLQDASGTIWNVQTIGSFGSKFFLPGRKAGLWHMLGEPVDGAPLGIAEGLATATTVREATGLPVAVAFDSGNLVPVAQALRGIYPASAITLFGDDDRFLPARGLPNVGREKAGEAARAVGGRAVFPVFADGREGTDWNDLAYIAGIEDVRRALDPLTSHRTVTERPALTLS